MMGKKGGLAEAVLRHCRGGGIILLPEQPYDIDRVCSAVERRAKKGSNFSIIAVAEGAINCEEAGMKRKEWMAKRAEAGFGTTATNRIAQAVQKKTGMETRVCIPGHMQRGGSPSAYDRVLATQFGLGGKGGGAGAGGRPPRRGGPPRHPPTPPRPPWRPDPPRAGELRPAHRRPPHGHQSGLITI